MQRKVKKFLIKNSDTLSKGLKKMEKHGIRTLLVIDKSNKYLGTLADGDIRRSIIKKKKVSDKIDKIYKRKTIFFYKNKFSIKKARTLFVKNRIEIIPIINKNRQIIDIINYYKLSSKGKKKKSIKKITRVGVIIMAGGKGTRLLPYTKVLPKPLIPVKGKTLIEHVISQFTAYNLRDFIFTINYKALTFKAFFKELNPDINYDYIEEKKPLGTAGALARVKSKKFKNFFVTTCDTVIKTDYRKVYKFHQNNNSDITIIAANISNKLPYGVLKYGKRNTLAEFKEKPILKHVVNTGMYLVSSKIFNLIPKNKSYNMNELITKASSFGKKISLYKINKKSWKDFGRPASLDSK